ncbi:MAG: hypothetical protein CMI59_10380 [Parvibaculum sp.]|nr:hypothetical protein [Parvibaculum sp.]
MSFDIGMVGGVAGFAAVVLAAVERAAGFFAAAAGFLAAAAGFLAAGFFAAAAGFFAAGLVAMVLILIAVFVHTTRPHLFSDDGLSFRIERRPRKTGMNEAVSPGPHEGNPSLMIATGPSCRITR